MTFNPNQIMNYQSIYTVSPDEQIVSTTLQVVSGSEITYQPAINSDYVVYEISFTSDHESPDTTVRSTYYLESGSLGGSFSEVEGCINNHGGASSSPKDIKSLTYVVPSWIGYKNLRLSVDAYDNSKQAKLHNTYHWEGSISSKKNSVRLEVFSIRNFE